MTPEDKANKRRTATRLAAKVRRAWIAGKIPRLPCERCGTWDQLKAHHEDYSKPFDITWLCHTHHIERHVEIRRELKQATIEILQSKLYTLSHC